MKNIYTTRTWAEIDLDALAYNMQNIRHATANDAAIMCIVKADAYGHGFFALTKTLQENGADAFGVATFEEAALLRDRGFEEPILVLGRVDDSLAPDMVARGISATVCDMRFAKSISDAAVSLGKQAKIHIKLDTGMSRIGFGCTEKDAERIFEICHLPNIEPEGIFSHFACADEKDPSISDAQFARFQSMLTILQEKGVTFPYAHICNSAGIIQFPERHMSMVRPGIILYGCYPSSKVEQNRLPLKPVMTVKARIMRIETLPAGTPVSYGATYKTEKETKIATVSIGYADGYFRSFSGKAYMTVHGVKAPVVGRICMDQCMIDVSNVNTICVGDEAIVFGNGGDGSETATTLAAHAGTISYELLCAVGNRTPRIYTKNGEIVDVLTYLK